MRVGAKLIWLHVACSGALAHYFIHPKRGQVAMDAMGILPHFTGTSVHDGWSSYALTMDVSMACATLTPCASCCL
ncbi:MAG: transposase [Trichocoleus desertorum ATA4-8-CV12]|nr:transposase [Trichocoleus desertorum ATA4-8-CV12]